MSSVTIIVLIVTLLVVLLAYAFISQTMERRRKQKQRLLSALRQRAKNFKVMISGFPSGFLTRDLNVLVHKCLVDVTGQISQLEGKSRQHAEELAHYSKLLEVAKRQPETSQRNRLQNPQQVKEVRALLQDLNTVIGYQQQNGLLPAQQHRSYESEIRQLLLQVSVDSYLLNARQAEGSGKQRLAVHFYTLAAKLLDRNNNGSHSSQIATLKQKIEELEQAAAEQDPAHGSDHKSQQLKDDVSRAWDAFEEQQEREDWKKKSLYD